MGLFDFLRKKNRSAPISDEIKPDDLPYHKGSGIYHSNSNPEMYTVIYEFGHVYRIFPDPGGSYYDKIGMILDARYIISSGVRYDLNDINSVYSIEVPEYHLHAENQRDKELGIISALEYLLNEKYHHFSIGNNSNLAIACLEKSTQLMVYSDVKWQLENFYEIVDSLKLYKEYQRAEQWKIWLDKNIKPIKLEENKNKPLTYDDKERIMVERMKAEDMLQFTAMPYNLNCPLKKRTGPKVHAEAYMDLTDENISIAKIELQKINAVIDNIRKVIPSIPKWARIDINKIAFYEYSDHDEFGHSSLICTPYTYTGGISRYPLILFFVSVEPKNSIGYSVNGRIKYTADGKIFHATVNCWYRRSWERPREGWLYVLHNKTENLAIYQILSTTNLDKYGQPGPVYKCPELIEEERQREEDYRTYNWLKENLPDLCPKSASAFRTMKTKNTKNYQIIVTKAKDMGYIIK